MIMMPTLVYHAPSALVTTPALPMQMFIHCAAIHLCSSHIGLILRPPRPHSDLSLRLICMKAFCMLPHHHLCPFLRYTTLSLVPRQ